MITTEEILQNWYNQVDSGFLFYSQKNTSSVSGSTVFKFAKSSRWEGDNTVRGKFNVQAGEEEDDSGQRSQEVQKQDRKPIRSSHHLWRRPEEVRSNHRHHRHFGLRYPLARTELTKLLAPWGSHSWVYYLFESVCLNVWELLAICRLYKTVMNKH